MDIVNLVKDLFNKKNVSLEIIFPALAWAIMLFVNVAKKGGSESDLVMLLCILALFVFDLAFIISVYVGKVPEAQAKTLHHSVTITLALAILVKLIFYFSGNSDSWPEFLQWGFTANVLMAIYLTLRFARGTYRHYRPTEE